MPRGLVTTPLVAHYTNDFAGLLLPELASRIVPTREQAYGIVPVPALTAKNVLANIYPLHFSVPHDYPIVHLQRDGTMIFGCSLSNPMLPREVIDVIRTTNDVYYNDAIMSDAPQHYETIFPNAEIEKSV